MVNEKVLPSPSMLSTQMVPPWSSVKALAMARPSPEPLVSPDAPSGDGTQVYYYLPYLRKA